MQINTRHNTSFGSHLTPKFIKIIENTNPRRAELKLAKLGIKAYFDENKTLAACVWQTVKIFQALNLPLPKKIFAFYNTPTYIQGLAQSNFRVKFNLFKQHSFLL